MQLFKYINFNKTMNQLQETLSRCAGDLLGFAIMFFIILYTEPALQSSHNIRAMLRCFVHYTRHVFVRSFAFAQFGTLVFGANMPDYKTFGETMYATRISQGPLARKWALNTCFLNTVAKWWFITQSFESRLYCLKLLE